MPHPRLRHVLPRLLKRLAFSPVTAIQGPRQTGKSFLAREILPKTLPDACYVTFDRAAAREFAESNPEAFLAARADAHPLIVDEAQKVPALFDAVKAEVDEKRRPGRYLLLGSTEFSKMTLIRESLTGRMSRVRLFPMNMAEVLKLPPNPSRSPIPVNHKPRANLKQLMLHLENGGMPVLFSIRDAEERALQMQDWLELTAYRDSQQFRGVKISGDLCMAILRQLATLPEPTAAALTRALGRNPRSIRTHLEALKTLFAVTALQPLPGGTGKTFYFLCDVGLAAHLGADFERRLHTWALNELLSQSAYRGETGRQWYYYRGPKGGIVHFVLEDADGLTPVKILPRETFDGRQLEVLKAFKSRYATRCRQSMALGAERMTDKRSGAEIHPWTAIG